jgi:hypothetical protein
MAALSTYQSQQQQQQQQHQNSQISSMFNPATLAQLYMNGSSNSDLQMALTAAAALVNQQQQQQKVVDFDPAATLSLLNSKNQVLSSLLPELFLQQQQQQQQQDLLLASYLQPLLQQQNQLNLESSSLNTNIANNNTNTKQGEETFKCRMCRNSNPSLSFASKKELRKHMRIQHGYTGGENTSSTTTTTTTKNVNTNNSSNSSNSNNNQKPVSVNNNNNNNNNNNTKSKFSEQQPENEDDRLVSSSSLHECEDCEVLFRNKDKFSKHRQMHEAYDKFVAGGENKTNTNGESEKFKCNFCSFELPSLVEYFLHIQTVHHFNSNTSFNASTPSAKLAQFI